MSYFPWTVKLGEDLEDQNLSESDGERGGCNLSLLDR